MSEQLNLKLLVLKPVRQTEIQCLFTVYSEKRPSSMKDGNSPFYLCSNYTKNPTEKPWFKASPMAAGNKLNTLMKTMADKPGFDEKRRLTNHGAQKL